ncbi:molybdate ABC transporter, ATPase subunit [Ancylobacter novellus DSM 506]|uniref:Molybdate ABC transporter, ATPase subunit n=1 Tax=Ancylobacter novellus (strain ATCC 8093 / DSM 506 / JCM 20403 / CCM 1077 / IAM 12100 / NBRC 12443 / NCIMB 10456) TaxID=639283 RepID=D7A4I3_ANCN5|nr:molybdenum ABC transporter ATP-binding protein [Ancylobacter novellus]ADH89846.1 molybdate ABC transporter, ATPase subunit [Ancylobacter novellus DSM 506]
MIEIDIRLARPGGFSLQADFTVPNAGVTALFGRSGAGKTTIIQAVAGVVRPDEGRIAVDGETFFDAARGIDVPIEARRVGYVFQEARLFPHLSVEKNLRYGERRSRAAERPIAFDAVVELLGIGHLLTRRPHTLSGGERQRAAIGRALLAQPRLLLMDEPLASLDEARKAEILPYLERLRDRMGLPILYVSHSVDEVLRLADTVVALQNGRQVARGPVAEAMARPEMVPIVGRFDVGALLDCTVARHDPAYALSSLAFAGGELRVPQVDLPVGAPVRARVRARDVALALAKPADVSVSNLLPAIVEEIRLQEGPYADVMLKVGEGRLTSTITRESVERLALRPGLALWAMIKSVAVDSRNPDFGAPG